MRPAIAAAMMLVASAAPAAGVADPVYRHRLERGGEGFAWAGRGVYTPPPWVATGRKAKRKKSVR